MEAEIITTDAGVGLATDDGDYITTEGDPIPPPPSTTTSVLSLWGDGLI